MDNRTLKALLIKLRDEDGYSFRQISEILKMEYGVMKSHQALNSMYNRIKRDNEGSEDELVKRTHVVNLNDLGYSKEGIVALMKERLGIKISLNSVKKILSEEVEYGKKVTEQRVKKIEELIRTGVSLNEIRDVLKYEGISITDGRLVFYVSETYAEYMAEEVKEMLDSVEKIMGGEGNRKYVYERMIERLKVKR